MQPPGCSPADLDRAGATLLRSGKTQVLPSPPPPPPAPPHRPPQPMPARPARACGRVWWSGAGAWRAARTTSSTRASCCWCAALPLCHPPERQCSPPAPLRPGASALDAAGQPLPEPLRGPLLRAGLAGEPQTVRLRLRARDGRPHGARPRPRSAAYGAADRLSASQHLPEGVFGQNWLQLAHEESGACLRFEVGGALLQWVLRSVEHGSGGLKVPAASVGGWAEKYPAMFQTQVDLQGRCFSWNAFCARGGAPPTVLTVAAAQTGV
eukprot:COSAG04_NODE_315_length_17025_cov_118.870318_9_plen_267_part_00